MAKPRRVIPRTTYILTRRVYLRTFRLRPNQHTNQIVRYCLAWTAKKHGVLVHGFLVMSNHIHVVVTDVYGVLPAFMRDFHRTTAKVLNSSQGQWENLWSVEKASAVRLPTIADVVRKIAYVVANPVTAGLVETPEQWPGVLHWEPDTSLVVSRPKVYFGRRTKAPPEAVLEIVPLPNLSEDEGAAWEERVRTAVDKAVQRAQAGVLAKGMKFLGADKVLGKSFLDRARSYEAKFQINPILAARDVQVRQACKEVERAFQFDYRVNFEAWRAGNRKVQFPYGTWEMRVVHGAAVLGPCPFVPPTMQ